MGATIIVMIGSVDRVGTNVMFRVGFLKQPFFYEEEASLEENLSVKTSLVLIPCRARSCNIFVQNKISSQIKSKSAVERKQQNVKPASLTQTKKRNQMTYLPEISDLLTTKIYVKNEILTRTASLLSTITLY